MYEQSNTVPRWGDSLTVVSSDESSGLSGWIASHPWMALGLALLAGFAVASGKGNR